MFSSRFLQPRRTEELVALGRIAIAAFSLAAFWFDPVGPARIASIAYPLLAAYTVYAVVSTAIIWRSASTSETWRKASHIVDVAVLMVLIVLSGGSEGPLFVWFAFLLFSTGTRFGTTPTAVTATILVGATFVSQLLPGMVPGKTPAIAGALVHPLYLTVVAVLIVYAVDRHKRLKDEFARLASWPSEPTARREDLARSLLRYSLDLLDVPGGLLIWEESEEPWLYVARWTDGGFTFAHEPPDRYALPNGSPGFASFIAMRRRGSMRTTTFDHATLLSVTRDIPLHPELVAQLALPYTVSSAISGENLTGRIFFMAEREMNVDDILLAEVAARFVAARLDQFTLMRRIEENAVTRERARISRDLHDSLLQSLTGASYQLEALNKLIPDKEPLARKRVSEIQKIIASDQRDLRELVLSLRPRRSAEDASEATILIHRLSNLAKRFERQWGLKVEIDVSALPATFDAPLRHEIYNVASEAIANAAKHAEATRIHVSIARQEERIRMVVEDNGKGFPFQGRFNLVTLEYMKRGPVTLKERIGLLGGEMVLDSRADGTRLEIELPIRIEDFA
ncbi:MAG: sensor histidine kinase [Thermoanaerobaculia bacterium]